MRRSVPFLSAALAAAPLAISHPDSSMTDFRIAWGSGSYADVSRGCDNSVISAYKINYDNVGADVSHKFTAPVRLGVRGGALSTDFRGYPYGPDLKYVNPYASLEWPGISIGGGWVKANGPFPDEDEGFDETVSGHIRLGKRTYFEMSFFEGVPLITAGYAQIGIGHRMPRADLWLGTAAVPHDHFGLVTRGEYRFGDRLGVGGTLRLGGSQGISENAFALSLSYRFTHRRERRAESSAAPAPHEPLSAPWWPGAPADSATGPAASDSVRSPRRGRSRAPRDRRSRRAPC